MLETEEFPEETLFCGDAGFVGYPLWHTILARLANFLVRVGANVSLLSETADIQKCGGRIVLCWPKGQMNLGVTGLPEKQSAGFKLFFDKRLRSQRQFRLMAIYSVAPIMIL